MQTVQHLAIVCVIFQLADCVSQVATKTNECDHRGDSACSASVDENEENDMRNSLLQYHAGQHKTSSGVIASTELDVRRASLLTELKHIERDLLLTEQGVNETKGPTKCAWTAGCGQFRSGDPCHCNDECVKYNSCCDDYKAACGQTCVEKGCGEYTPGAICQCNVQCEKYHSCCGDYKDTCLTTTTTTIGPCARMNCNNHGDATGITPNCDCSCDDGWIGDSCGKQLCEQSDCNDRGVVSGVKGECSCTCNEGYTGDMCEQELCSEQDCHNHGNATGIRPKCECTCHDGWTGYQCKDELCTDAEDCNGHGEAHGLKGRCWCKCYKGWTGHNCQDQYCGPEDCSNHGRAWGIKPRCGCNCDRGWGSKDCSIPYCTDKEDCNGHGHASGLRPDCKCNCWREFEGDKCDMMRPKACKELGCQLKYVWANLCQCHADCLKSNNCCSDFEDVCSDFFYRPSDSSLSAPSNAETMSFYLYRAQEPKKAQEYSLENVNLASIGGVMWYLHNEIIQTCNGAGGVGGDKTSKGTGTVGDRKFKVTRIRRLKITYKPTAPLHRAGLNFGPLCSYDAGECTGPHWKGKKSGVGSGMESKAQWDKYGYIIGCGKIGEWPHQDWKSGKSYPNPVWYSLAGECPAMNYKKSSKYCKITMPGGLCDKPTGAGNCTYTYEEAGDIDVDELVGITPRWKNRADFCRRCHTEGSAYSRSGCGLQFWGYNIWDSNSARKQVQAALDMFNKKYPDMPSDSDMPEPPCDFNKQKYGW